MQSAYIGSSAQVLNADALTVDASHDRDLTVFGVGGAVGGVAAGVSIATLTAGGTVEAYVGSNAILGQVDSGGTVIDTLGSVSINAQSTTTQAKASANAVAAGIGAAVTGTIVDVLVDPTVIAATEDGVEIYATGDIDITASANAYAEASAFGVEIAIGATGGLGTAVAEVSADITAKLGANNILEAANLTVKATQAKISGKDDLVYADGFGVGAALLVGIRGTSVRARSNTTSQASLADGVTLTADTLRISAAGNDALNVNMSALNDTGSGQLTGTTVSSVSAGFAGIGGTLFDGEIKQTTSTEIGSGAQINAGLTLTGNPTEEGSINLSAINDSFLVAVATANASGAVSSAEAEAKMDYSTYIATVSVGADATIKSTGEISMATTAGADSRMNAEAVAAAVLPEATAGATSTISVDNNVVIGTDALIESEGDINLIAGQTSVFKSGDGSDDVPEPNVLRMRSDAQAYAKVLPRKGNLNTNATSNATNLNQITIGSGASIRTVGDAYLIAETGATLVQANAAEHRDGDQNDGGTSTLSDPRAAVVVNGSVDVGVLNQKFLDIGIDGTILEQSEGIEFDTDTVVSLGDIIQDRVNELLGLVSWYWGTDLVYTYLDEIGFWKEVALGLDPDATFELTGGGLSDGAYVVGGIDETVLVLKPISARGGDIIVEADNLVGSGDLRAAGDALIEILNRSTQTIKTGALSIETDSGGRLTVNGTLVTDNNSINALNIDTSTSNASFSEVVSAAISY